LPPHDEGTLVFCSHCGAPQVLLSEELLTQVETQNKVAADGTSASRAGRDPRSQVWAGAIRCAALAGAIAAGFSCLAILLPPIGALTLLWMVVSPVVILGMVQARYPMAPMSTGFGARVGLLTGLSITTAMSIVQATELVVRRVVAGGHGMIEFDAQWDGVFKQVQEQSGASAVPFIQALSVAEFRAGFLLVMLTLGSVFLILITTAGGAFAGFARLRSRA
jgi:hypothetical protein